MSPQLPTLYLPTSSSAYGVAGIIATFLILLKLSQSSKLHAIPTVGSSGWLSSWWAGYKFRTNPVDVVHRGYRKYKSAPFKVADLYRWVVVLGSPEHVDELRKAPDDTLSFLEAINDRLLLEYTMGPELHHNPYHISVVRVQLTRAIGTLDTEIYNEIVTAFDDLLDLEGNEWKSVPVLNTMQNVVCRAANRLFVGLPLCRDPDWIPLNIQYAFDVFKEAAIIGLFPSFMRPMVAWFRQSIHRSQRSGRNLLRPMIEERLKHIKEHGKGWAEKPNDLLSWLIDEADDPDLSVESLSDRLLAVNFTAIHTTSLTFTVALFCLAANPEYTQTLREEVEAIVARQGWSKASVGEMRKVDSFLKECQRLEGTDPLTLMRIALKDFTFSDGTFVPKGTFVAAPAKFIQHDDVFYEDARTFKPFRFADLRGEDNEGAKYQFVSTTNEYLAFGHGRQACPGRFFAVHLLKTMFAHVLLTYDVEFPDGDPAGPQTPCNAKRAPPDYWIAKLTFRKRVE